MRFAFLDYEKAGVLVLLENVVMLMFWTFIGSQTAAVCRKSFPAKKQPISMTGSNVVHSS